jgi:hypothetical protein
MQAPRCAATPTGATPAVDQGTQPTVAPIPTQAAVEAEQNPPGDIPDNQAFVVYTSTAGGYSISMPEGWARTEDGANVRFADKLHVFTVEISCANESVSVDAFTKVELPQLSQQIPAFELVDVAPISLPAGEGILIRYRTNSQPDEVTGKQYRLDVDRYDLTANGRLAVISLAVPAGSDNVDVSNLVSQSFRWNS